MGIPNLWVAALWGIVLFIAGLVGNAFFGRNNSFDWLLGSSIVVPLAGYWLTKFAAHIDRLENRIAVLEEQLRSR